MKKGIVLGAASLVLALALFGCSGTAAEEPTGAEPSPSDSVRQSEPGAAVASSPEGTGAQWRYSTDYSTVAFNFSSPVQLAGGAPNRFGFWDEEGESVGLMFSFSASTADEPEAVLESHRDEIPAASFIDPDSLIHDEVDISVASAEPVEIAGIAMARCEGAFTGLTAEDEPVECAFVAYTLIHDGADGWFFVYDNTPDQSVGVDALSDYALQIAETCEISED